MYIPVAVMCSAWGWIKCCRSVGAIHRGSDTWWPRMVVAVFIVDVSDTAYGLIM